MNIPMILKLYDRMSRPLAGLSIRLRVCKFRWKFYCLDFGGAGGHGTAIEWLALRIELVGIPV